jgi:transposase
MKNNIAQGSSQRGTKGADVCQGSITIGMDLGDRTSRYCVLGGDGEVLREGSVKTSQQGLHEVFAATPACRIAIEVGPHSPWVSRLLSAFGHQVIVANARQVKLISAASRKNDKLDARTLARLARLDPQLLRPIRHRSEQAQLNLMQIRVRAELVEMRTAAVNAARGLAKAVGERVPKCDPSSLGREALAELPEAVQTALKPLLEEVEALTEKIHGCYEWIEQIARTEYPETELLKQVHGVGTLIALTFVLTVEEPARFSKSREVGCYVGVCPKIRNSGDSEPQLGISKEGDIYLRKLLVQAGHLVLQRRAPDTDLKRWGLKLAGRGGKNAKKRAVVAVARKLSILLHRLWVTGAVYEPLRNSHVAAATQKKKVA